MKKIASPLIILLCFSQVLAGQLENNLLASASARLDVTGVQIALRRGAKADDAQPHPDSPSVTETPVQFVLSALVANEATDAAKRAETILKSLFKAGGKLTGDQDELFPIIYRGYDRLLLLLLDHGASPHARLNGYLPTELAIKYRQEKLLPIFYKRGLPQVDSQTAAQIQFVSAAGRQNRLGMRLAVLDGADVNQPDPAGELAIVQVFSAPLSEPEGYESVKWLLFEAGADPSAEEISERKSTALHNAIKRNSYSSTDFFSTAAIVEMLLQKGAIVSALDDLGRTPLHYAAKTGNVLAMQVLLRHGAKVHPKDNLRKTPMDLATSGEAIQTLRNFDDHK